MEGVGVVVGGAVTGLFCGGLVGVQQRRILEGAVHRAERWVIASSVGLALSLALIGGALGSKGWGPAGREIAWSQ
jgi:hypothetical protein